VQPVLAAGHTAGSTAPIHPCFAQYFVLFSFEFPCNPWSIPGRGIGGYTRTNVNVLQYWQCRQLLYKGTINVLQARMLTPQRMLQLPIRWTQDKQGGRVGTVGVHPVA